MKYKLKRDVVIVVWLMINIVNIHVYYKDNIVSVTDYISLFVFMASFLIGLRIIKYNKIVWGIIYIAFIDYLMIDAQSIRSVRIDGNEATVFLNMLVIYCVLYLFYILFCEKKAGLVIPQLFFIVISVVNYYLISFRGRSICFSDVRSIKTVLNVTRQYNLTVDREIVLQVVCLCIICYTTYMLTCNSTNLQSNQERNFNINCKIITMAVVVIILFNSVTLSHFGYYAYWWDNTSQNGFLLGMILQAEECVVKKSKTYKDTMNLIQDEHNDEMTNSESPDVIVIMNESFSDLSVINSFNTNKDYMPFFHSLNENCVKGNLYVSVKGGNTANTEYEFLTGDSMAFYKYGQVVYNSYVNHSILSNVSHLKNKEYTSVAFHPFFKSGWNRVNVYNNLGFEQNIFLEDLWDQGENVGTLRLLASDQYTYDKIERIYNDMPVDKQRFIFCVTMQNHAGYDNAEWVQQQQISLVDSGDYPLTEQYLSLIYESDKALEDLIETYRNVNRKVVICFFGDHQPGIESAFFEKLYGKSMSELSLEEVQKGYITPFLIWTNYDIQSEYIDKISANYLFSYMCKVAGIPMSAYDKYLIDLYDKYPVVNSIGGIDRENNYYSADELKSNSDIQQYFDIIYNQMIDKHICVNFFE